MVRVPGSSGDAGFHRESHEEEKTSVKIDQGTTKTLETGSPVIKKEEGSEDRQSPGRSSAIEVMVEYEEKPPHPPSFVFAGEYDTGYNYYYSPGSPSSAATAKEQWAPKQVSPNTPQETPVPPAKMKKYMKLKAPEVKDETDESGGNQGITSEDWTEADLEEAYHRTKLMTMLKKDLVMKMLKVKLQGPVHGPVTALPTMTTDLEVLKALLNLLQEAGMVAGNFKVKTLFDFGFKVLYKILVTLHDNLKAIVKRNLSK